MGGRLDHHFLGFGLVNSKVVNGGPLSRDLLIGSRVDVAGVLTWLAVVLVWVTASFLTSLMNCFSPMVASSLSV